MLAVLLMLLLMLLGGCSCEPKVVVLEKRVYSSFNSVLDNYVCKEGSLPEGNVTEQSELMGYFIDNYIVATEYSKDCAIFKKERIELGESIKLLNEKENNRIFKATKEAKE